MYLITYLQLRCAVRTALGFDRDGACAVRAFLGGWVCDRRWFLDTVHDTNDQEDDERNDGEVYNGLHKGAPFDDRRANRKSFIREIDPAEDQPN